MLIDCDIRINKFNNQVKTYKYKGCTLEYCLNECRLRGMGITKFIYIPDDDSPADVLPAKAVTIIDSFILENIRKQLGTI